mgnify:CR=1 FL=1
MVGDRPAASGPSSTGSASWKSPAYRLSVKTLWLGSKLISIWNSVPSSAQVVGSTAIFCSRLATPRWSGRSEPGGPSCTRTEPRWSRRGDVVFYVTRLLGLRGREAGALARRVREQPALRDEPYVALAARVLADRAGGTGTTLVADDVRADLRARLQATRADLEDLAQLLAVAGERLGCDAQALTARDGRIYATEHPRLDREIRQGLDAIAVVVERTRLLGITLLRYVRACR